MAPPGHLGLCGQLMASAIGTVTTRTVLRVSYLFDHTSLHEHLAESQPGHEMVPDQTLYCCLQKYSTGGGATLYYCPLLYCYSSRLALIYIYAY